MKIRVYGQMMFNLGILFFSCQGITNANLRLHMLDQINRVLNDLDLLVGDGEIK